MQEYIPLECILATLYLMGGLPDKDLCGQRPFGTETPVTETT